MSDICTEIDSADYKEQTPSDIIHNLTQTVNALHRIGTTNQLLSAEDKAYLQYAHDVLKATRNGLQDETPKDEPSAPVVVTARKGDIVRAVSGLRFRHPVRPAR